MFHYQKLDSEKYYAEHVKKEYRQLRRRQGAEAMQTLAATVLVVAVFGVILFQLSQIPDWGIKVNDYIQSFIA